MKIVGLFACLIISVNSFAEPEPHTFATNQKSTAALLHPIQGNSLPKHMFESVPQYSAPTHLLSFAQQDRGIASSNTELLSLLQAQTEAIKLLTSKIEALEERIAKIEKRTH